MSSRYKCNYCGIKFTHENHGYSWSAPRCPKCNTAMDYKNLLKEAEKPKIDQYKEDRVIRGDYFGYNKKR
jgi:hypothetical protein